MVTIEDRKTEIDQLRRDIDRHEVALKSFRHRRNTLILQLLDDGLSQREIATLAGVSGPYINQLANPRKRAK